MVASMEVWWSGGDVGSAGGRCSRQTGLVSGREETHLYEIVSPPKPRRRRTLLLAKTEAKR